MWRCHILFSPSSLHTIRVWSPSSASIAGPHYLCLPFSTLNSRTHTHTRTLYIQLILGNRLFLTVGVFNVMAGLWNSLTRKKHNHKHQKLNLLPLPALLSSPLPYLTSRFPSLHHPTSFICHFPLPVTALGFLSLSPSPCCLKHVIRSTNKWGKIAIFPPLSARWNEKRSPPCTNLRNLITHLRYLVVLVTSPSHNFHFSWTGSWHGRLMLELITHSVLHLIILYLTSCHQNLKTAALSALWCISLKTI